MVLRKGQETFFRVLILILLFLALNFDRDVGFLFALILVADFMWFMLDDKIELPFEKTIPIPTLTSRVLGIGIGIILGYAFIFTATIIMGLLGVTQSVVGILASTTPPLATSKIITVFTWGLLIPAVETSFFFGRILEGTITVIHDKFGYATTAEFNLLNIYNWWAAIIVSGLFMSFHFAAKGITEFAPLALTFLFGIVSCWTSLYFKQLRENIIMHATINTQAVLSRVGGLQALTKVVVG